MNTSDDSPPMPDEPRCPQCGAPLVPGALAGLCPACLLQQGAADDSFAAGQGQAFEPPSAAELAPLFPQLEILVATSAVKAIIRSGQFAKISSAIQTGGDDGMWTFERYGRWAEEKRDWVLPSAKAPEKEEGPPPRAAEPLPRATPKAEPAGTTGQIEIMDSGEDLEDLIQQMVRKEGKDKP